MIDGVFIKKIIRQRSKNGFFAELLKEDDPFFYHIKQTSYSETLPGVIKAFHYHFKQDDVWFVTKGNVMTVLYDLRDNSVTKGKTQVIRMGVDNPLLVFIPRGVAHGYKVLGKQIAGVIYHTTASYNPKDEFRILFDDPKIGFDWTK